MLLDEPFGMLDSLTRYELQKVLLDLWGRDHKTAMMVTHDVDEALYLADRVVMMTNGPDAEVGEILRVDFPRPRDRKEIMEHPDYYRYREHLIGFLEERADRKQRAASIAPALDGEKIVVLAASGHPSESAAVPGGMSGGDGLKRAEGG
jgi:ABC-type nitrate/sulfonate/bicarbonate transport system ATPase subunit